MTPGTYNGSDVNKEVRWVSNEHKGCRDQSGAAGRDGFVRVDEGGTTKEQVISSSHQPPRPPFTFVLLECCALTF